MSRQQKRRHEELRRSLARVDELLIINGGKAMSPTEAAGARKSLDGGASIEVVLYVIRKLRQYDAERVAQQAHAA